MLYAFNSQVRRAYFWRRQSKFCEGIMSDTYKINPVNKESESNLTIVEFGLQAEEYFPHKFGPAVKLSYVLQYVEKGCGTYTLNGNVYRVQAGDLFFLPKNSIVSYAADKENPYRYYWIDFDGLSAKNILHNIGISEENPVISLNNGEVLHRFRSVGDALEGRSYLSYLDALGRLYELLSFLGSLRAEYASAPASSAEQHVQDAISLIKHRYWDNLTVAQIAAEIGINRNYLSAVFKKYTGESPVSYLMKYRIQCARCMLQLGYSVIDTATRCGFNSPANFSMQFKRMVGHTPQKERKLSSGKTPGETTD